MNLDAFRAEDVWLLPGWQKSGFDAWMGRWQQRHGYQLLEQNDWQRPLRGDWSARLQETVVDAPRPVLLVAHGLACALVAWWAAHSPLAASRLRGALLVEPVDLDQPGLRARLPGWSPLMLQRLPFASTLVAGPGEEASSLERSRAMAQAWGACRVQDLGLQAMSKAAEPQDSQDWDSGHALLKPFEQGWKPW
ncbi:RBBP9/YdeN family alpha/beta hydrolase [Comamonas composti]|uniref:RBBP9/YdeN family alpha/beta hydrolase n=1 Tax=Comamonas composti TaxID=408558 RepID=UPI000400511D|nr:alpha/beta hydrolase [Comamonas composti]